jgi:hypothetical protein
MVALLVQDLPATACRQTHVACLQVTESSAWCYLQEPLFRFPASISRAPGTQAAAPPEYYLQDPTHGILASSVIIIFCHCLQYTASYNQPRTW